MGSKDKARNGLFDPKKMCYDTNSGRLGETQ